MSAFKITFLLRSGRDVEVVIDDEEDFQDDEELHGFVKDTIDDRTNSIWKEFGEATLLFSQIDGWKIEEYSA